MGYKTAEERDASVAMVQATTEKWPSLDKMPVADKGNETVSVGDEPGAYATALHELCSRGATPVGRDNGGTVVVGENASKRKTEDTGKTMKVGR